MMGGDGKGEFLDPIESGAEFGAEDSKYSPPDVEADALLWR